LLKERTKVYDKSKFPEGYQTMVGRRFVDGVELGGEWQS
jgi:hypothetical protein